MKKIIISSIIVMTMLSGCVTKFAYDNNKQIASDTNTYTIVNYKDNILNGEYEAQIAEFAGMDTIWKYNAKEDEIINIKSLLSVKNGKAKTVFIDGNNKVYIIDETTEENKKNKTYNLPVKKGINRIKLVSIEKSKIDLNFTIKEGEFQTLGLEMDL